ncbi:MAG: IS66 family transposase ISDpr4 [Legionella sp.]|uniref:IS66 family transposase n=1 Tax=Legionella sp. TaxID=459 RepID=UPI003D105789
MTDVSALSLEQLQQENARLLALIEEQEDTIKQQKSSLETLQHQLHLFRTARFGRKSEKGVVPEQMVLQFDEAVPVVEASPTEPTVEPETQTITYTRAKKNTGRKPLPQSLPYIEQVYDLSDEEKQCACGCSLTHIRDEVTEQLDVVPQMTFRVVHIRKQYACKACENTMKCAKKPEQPIPHSIATPGLIAAIINSKFRCHMPLYRQETMFNEAGISLTRGTLSNWVIKAADLLSPLVKLMEDDIQNHDIAYTDETTLQVLKEKDRAPTQKSYMWLFIGGPPSKRAFVYQYHPTRSHQIPADFFADFQGYLHADCYKAYVALGTQQHIQHVACWAHARRYFVDVAKTTKKHGLAHGVITLIGTLYQLEKSLKESNAQAPSIFAARIQKAKPIVDELKELLDQASLKVLPKSPLGQAVFYALTHWEALKSYLYDGRLEIDNNLSERSIKPFVIGRKNWLFHGNDIGARSGAILYSLIETCKYHKVDVFSWFKYALTHIQQAHTLEQMEALLPYNINVQLLADLRSIPHLCFPK